VPRTTITEVTLPNGQTVYGVSRHEPGDTEEPIIIAVPTEVQARELLALARSGASLDVLVEFIKGKPQ
jgi:hypothetical protein